MDPKLEKYLEIAECAEREQRNNHLRLLGLTDNTKKASPIYAKKEFKGSIYDSVSKRYYTDKAAIDVTDEEYAEICKYGSPSTSELLKRERLLNTLSKIFLWVGLLGGLIIIGMCSSQEQVGVRYSRYEEVFHPEILAYGLATMLTSVLVYAFCQVVIQISLSLKNKTSLKD
ncbi:MAG: hypothetical protein R3Y38_06470 [Rikenellaceae bacterium]